MINATEQLDLIESELPEPKRKRCYNCKFAGEQFKIGNKTHLHCQNRELYPEADLKSGNVSPWETLMEWRSTCDKYEFKQK